jgi:hypothetical protein
MKARPVGPGKFSIGPEHNTSEMLRSHPSKPVPMTAKKMATGAAKAARRTSSLRPVDNTGVNLPSCLDTLEERTRYGLSRHNLSSDHGVSSFNDRARNIHKSRKVGKLTVHCTLNRPNKKARPVFQPCAPSTPVWLIMPADPNTYLNRKS